MTKEELEKEAIKYAVDYPTSYGKGYKHKDLRIAYLAGAEPREKRISELEYQLTHRNCLDCSNHSSKLRMRNLELEKENAELKGLKDVATLIRANNDTVTTLMQLNNKLVSKEQQLTKAKEIIRQLLLLPYANNEEVFADVTSILDKAEQFLSEVEK